MGGGIKAEDPADDPGEDPGGGPTGLPVDEVGERLIEAAAEVFAESGYEGARVQQIARRAGLTTGAIYNRFDGKSELLLTAADRHSDKMLEVLLGADLQTPDVMIAAAASLVDTKPTMGEVLLYEVLLSARREPELAAVIGPRLAETRAMLAERIEADQADGIVHDDLDVHSLVVFSQAVMLGMGLLHSLGVEQPDGRHWEALINRLVRAVSAPPATADSNTTEETANQQPADDDTRG